MPYDLDVLDRDYRLDMALPRFPTGRAAKPTYPNPSTDSLPDGLPESATADRHPTKVLCAKRNPQSAGKSSSSVAMTKALQP